MSEAASRALVLEDADRDRLLAWCVAAAERERLKPTVLSKPEGGAFLSIARVAAGVPAEARGAFVAAMRTRAALVWTSGLVAAAAAALAVWGLAFDFGRVGQREVAMGAVASALVMGGLVYVSRVQSLDAGLAAARRVADAPAPAQQAGDPELLARFEGRLATRAMIVSVVGGCLGVFAGIWSMD